MNTSRVPKANPRPLLAVIYIRVSTARDGMVSPEIQDHSARTLAECEGITVVEVVTGLDESGRAFDKRQIEYIRQGCR